MHFKDKFDRFADFYFAQITLLYYQFHEIGMKVLSTPLYQKRVLNVAIFTAFVSNSTVYKLAMTSEIGLLFGALFVCSPTIETMW